MAKRRMLLIYPRFGNNHFLNFEYMAREAAGFWLLASGDPAFSSWLSALSSAPSLPPRVPASAPAPLFSVSS